MNNIHPAYKVPFNRLIGGLEDMQNQGYVTCKHMGDLSLWTYTNACVYDSMWNLYTTVARGLITNYERIVAAPFPKFFNLSENKTDIPDLPFIPFEKLDGSLIIAFWYNGGWMTATKGSFLSEQAIKAREILPDDLNENFTYLFELVGPSNKIVISYPADELVFLSSYNYATGVEDLLNCPPGCSFAGTLSFDEMQDVINDVEKLGSNEEGYVILFTDGTRVKVKGHEYLRLHRMISNITPLAIWEEMLDNEFAAWDKIKEIPEEFRKDYEIIFHILLGKLKSCVKEVGDFYYETQHLTDKELGLMLPELNPLIRKLIFPRRKNATILTGKSRQALFQFFRPTGNKLEGYTPSNSMNRVVEES